MCRFGFTREKDIKTKGYDFPEGAHVMEELLKAAPRIPGAYLFQLFVKKWNKLKEVQPLIQARRIAEAIPFLMEILDLDPECPLTCFQLAYCFRKTEGESLEKSRDPLSQGRAFSPPSRMDLHQFGPHLSGFEQRRQGRGSVVEGAGTFARRSLRDGTAGGFRRALRLALGEEDGRNQAFMRRSDYEKKMNQEIDRARK